MGFAWCFTHGGIEKGLKRKVTMDEKRYTVYRKPYAYAAYATLKDEVRGYHMVHGSVDDIELICEVMNDAYHHRHDATCINPWKD